MEAFLSRHTEGNTVVNLEFTSTTKGDIYNPDGQVQMYILDSKNGYDISSYNEKEQEVLFKNNSSFKVKSVEVIKGKYHILLEEINDE